MFPLPCHIAPCHASVCVSLCFSLKERQGEWRKEEERRKANAPDPSIPPGHTLMPAAERRKTLDMLKDSECVCVHACVHVCVCVVCWWLSSRCVTFIFVVNQASLGECSCMCMYVCMYVGSPIFPPFLLPSLCCRPHCPHSWLADNAHHKRHTEAAKQEVRTGDQAGRSWGRYKDIFQN